MNQKTVPTATQINVLMSDWLGNLREAGTFINKSTKASIQRTIKRGGAISDYFLGDTSQMDSADILCVMRKIAQQTVDAMTQEKIKVVIGKYESFTDGQQICVASDFFDDSTLSLGQKIDILLGYSIHEACHINHSDFKSLMLNPNENPNIARIRNTINNILEDERIELLLGDEPSKGGDGMPGYADYIGAAKQNSFGKYEQEKKDLRAENLQERIPRFLNALLKAVRFPSALTEEEVIENFDELDAVRKVLTPFPRSARGVNKATDAILDIIKNMIKEQLEQEQQEQQQQQQSQQSQQQSQQGQQSSSGNNSQSQDSDGGGSQEQDGSDSQDKSDGNNASGDNSDKDSGSQQQQTGNDQNSPDQKGGDQQRQDGNSQNGDGAGQDQPQNNSGPSKKQITEALSNALATSEANAVMQSIEVNVQAPKGGNCDNDSRKSGSGTKDPLSAYINGDAERGDGAGGNNEINFFIKTRNDKSAYDRSLERVKAFVPAMSKVLRCKTEERDYCLQGLPSGKLNTNKLATLKTGNKNIFCRQSSVTADSACICILIDESQSMAGQRLLAARDTAVLINEALRPIPNLELFVYGYTGNRLTIYCERKNAQRYALGSTVADGGTPTGAAMEVAARRIRRFTKTQCMMLIITDGCPNDERSTRQQDALLPKKGIIPVGVDIMGSSAVSSLFNEAISITDMNELAPLLGKIVKKRLLKNIKRYDNI